ncbi:MAG: tetratricopeptide repeat protein [Bernardetiaceae bacterium]
MLQRCLFLILLISCCWGQSALAQTVIEPPVVGMGTSENFTLQKLELTDQQTVLYLELVCLDGDVIHVESLSATRPQWYLQVDTDKRLPLVALQEAQIGNITCQEDTPIRYFAMVFPPIPKGTVAFDLMQQGKLWLGNILTEALETARQKADAGSPLHQRVLGIYYEKEYDYDAAQKYYQSYLQQLKSSGKQNSEDYQSGLYRLVRLYVSMGEAEQARRLTKDALQQIGKEQFAAAQLLFTLGDIEQLSGQHQAAIDAYLSFAQLKRKHQQLRRRDLFQLYNMVLYSYGALPEPPPPIPIGAAWLEQPQLDTPTRLQVFAVGASQMRFGVGAAFADTDWKAYEMYTSRVPPATGERLFVQFKDGKGRVSDVVECLTAQEE